jgi:hypothetical protein
MPTFDWNKQAKNIVSLTEDNSLTVKNINRQTTQRLTGFMNNSYEVQSQELKEMLGNYSFDIIDFSNDQDSNLNGLYSLTAGGVSQVGGNLWRTLTATLTGPFQRYKWIVGSNEFDTDWDSITTSAFIAGFGATAETAEAADTNCKWKAAVGNWTDAGGFLTCTFDSGWNHFIVVEARGYDYPAVANVTVQAEVKQAADTAAIAGLSLRYQRDGDVVNGTGYTFGFSTAADEYEFIHHSIFGSATLKTWPTKKNWDIVYDTTYYTLKVVCQGNRFDCYADNEDGDLVWVGFVDDDRYKTGWYGVTTEDTNGIFDDFSLSIAKPQALALPVGAHDINRIRMPTTSRLCDDVSANGLQRTTVAVENPVTFKQGIQYLNDPSCILYLPMDEGVGTTVYDYSGNDNNGTLTGGPIWIDNYINGKKQKGIKFDGASDYIAATRSDFLNTSFTYMIYMKRAKTGTSHVLMDTSDALNDCVKLTLINTDKARLSINALHTDTTSDIDTDWHLITAVIDLTSQTVQMYLDGSADGSAGDISAQTIAVTSTDFMIGRHDYVALDYFEGCIAFAKIYNRALSASEVKEKYDTLALNQNTGGEVKVWDTNGEDGLWDYLEFHAKLDEGEGTSIYDSSKNNVAITETSIAGTEWAASYNKWAKTSIHLDGANDYFTFTNAADNPDLDGDLTLIAWVNRDTFNTTDVVIDARDADNDGILFYIPSTDEIEFQYNTVDVDSTSTITTTGWHMIAVTINKSTNLTQIYFDGEVDGSAGDISGQTIAVTAALRVGEATVGSAPFDGYIDDVMIFQKCLSADRIKWLYENMPNTVIETAWTNPDTGNTIGGWARVRDPHHVFVGDMIADNGLIRLQQFYRQPDGDTSAWHKTWPSVSGYADGIWNDAYRIWPHYNTVTSHFEHYPFIIKELTKHKVVFETETETDGASNNDWIKLEFTVNSSSPFCLVKLTDWLMNGGQNMYLYLRTKGMILLSAIGNDQSPRFACVTLDTTTDYIVDGTTSANETEGLSLMFSTQNNQLMLVFDQDASNWQVENGANYLSAIRNLASVNFDADEPPHYFAIGLMPFDTSVLHITGDDDTLWTNEIGTQAEPAWANLGNVVYVDAGGASATMTSPTTLVGGSYRAFVLWAGDGGVTDGTFTCTGAISNGTITNNAIADAGTWDFIDIIAGTDTDVITFSITENASGNALNCGGIVIWPISNAKNFPLDVRDQMLANISINESVGDE